jgi:lipopolysaccharide cholinephosphotransferase
VNQHIQLLKSYDYDSADFCGQLCIMDYPEKEHNPKAYYESRIKMQFCDMEFNVINGYDEFLKHYYGNYMELPPEEKRIIPPEVTQTYYRL